MKPRTMKLRIGKYVVEHLRIPRTNKVGNVIHYSPYIKNQNMVGKPIMRRIKNLGEFHRYFDRDLQAIEHSLVQSNRASYQQPQPKHDAGGASKLTMNPNYISNNNFDNQNNDGLK